MSFLFDAIKERDGNQIILIWKFLLLVFRASHKETIVLKLPFCYFNSSICFHPAKLLNYITFSRFVNIHGKVRCNIPCDLHMELLNRCLKEMMNHLESNIRPHMHIIKHAGESIGLIHHIAMFVV